jgi:integrase
VSQEVTRYSSDPSPLARAAQAADIAAGTYVLTDYLEKVTRETRRRQYADIALFERYLAKAGVRMQGMADDLRLWQDISDGLVRGFVRWQLQEGYATGSTNVRLATVKVYCHLAMQARYLPVEQYQRVRAIEGIRRKEGRSIDEKRSITRRGEKKAQATRITPAHVNLIKRELRKQADQDPFFASSLLLFCLLSDLGLRCGEVALLTRESLDLGVGQLRFYRHKVDKWQLHQLPPDVFAAARLYLSLCSPVGPLFPGKIPGKSLVTRTINWRVGEMGKLAGIEELSPHDLRHYWATYSKGDLGALQQAGGWNSLAMPLLYREESAIANEGLIVPGGVL